MGTHGGNGSWQGANPWAEEEAQQGGDRAYDRYGHDHDGHDRPVGPATARRTLLVPILAALTGLLLLGGVGVLGWNLLHHDRGAGPATTGVPGTEGSGTSGTGSPLPVTATPVTDPGHPVVNPVSVAASCQAPDSVDDAGGITSFTPGNAVDQQVDTAWRCAGAGGGRLEFTFADPTTVQTIGLIPGYAKIDPHTGANRFQENHTVTEATWTLTLEDGRSLTITQPIAHPSPDFTFLQLSEPQRVVAGTMTVTGTGNPSAIRAFTAVSEIRFQSDGDGPAG